MDKEAELYRRVVGEDAVRDRAATIWADTCTTLIEFLIVMYGRGHDELKPYIQNEFKAFLIRLERQCPKKLAELAVTGKARE